MPFWAEPPWPEQTPERVSKQTPGTVDSGAPQTGFEHALGLARAIPRAPCWPEVQPFQCGRRPAASCGRPMASASGRSSSRMSLLLGPPLLAPPPRSAPVAVRCGHGGGPGADAGVAGGRRPLLESGGAFRPSRLPSSLPPSLLPPLTLLFPQWRLGGPRRSQGRRSRDRVSPQGWAGRRHRQLCRRLAPEATRRLA